MTKRNKVVYWVITGLLAFGMLAQGIAQIIHTKGYVDMINAHLGYPPYFLNIIGVGKILGAIAILIPGFGLAKEWAYAGFFFIMSGAVISHIALGDAVNQLFPSLFLLLLIAASWYFRPANRRIISFHQ